jgi:DnaJ-class molecular chaperone
VAKVNLAYQVCSRCEGDGYQHLFGAIYRYPCKACNGTGERPRITYRIFQALRHGAAIREDY